MFDMRYLVNFPTRVTETSESARDNCIANIKFKNIKYDRNKDGHFRS